MRSVATRYVNLARRVKWDPDKHPRGPLGRFIDTTGPSSFTDSPERRRAQIKADEGGGVRGTLDDYWYESAVSGPPPNGLPVEQTAVVGDYVDGSWINQDLRDGMDLSMSEPGMGHLGIRNGEDYARELDSAIEQYTVNEDMTVYRGMFFDDFGDLQPGDQIVDRGYMSTSVDPAVASGFAYDRMEIRIPGGTNALPASKFNPLYAEQKELLLGRGAVLQVVQPPGEGDGRVNRQVMVVELVGYLDD